MEIELKSIYAPPDESDGFRLLMDRHWPRGMTRERARLDDWRRELAPSPGVAADWRSDGDFEAFRTAYLTELASSEAARDVLELVGPQQRLTVVYAASNPTANHAVVLVEELQRLVSVRNAA